MRKSSSVQLFPGEFNPKYFKVGASKIETLPIRRCSASNIHTLPSHTNHQDIDLLKRQNAALQKQNQQLIRQLQKMKLQNTNGTIRKTGQKTTNFIRGKLSSKTKMSRNTECQTRKEVSLEGSTLTISDYYDQYRMSQKAPVLTDLIEIADKFFKDYCDGYAKLKCLFDCLQGSKNSESYKKLENQIELYRVPLLYQKAPQILLRQISKSKERIKTKGREEDHKHSKKQKEEMCPEQLSPTETAMRIQALLGKVCRSSQILRMLRGNQTVLRFVLKIQERL